MSLVCFQEPRLRTEGREPLLHAAHVLHHGCVTLDHDSNPDPDPDLAIAERKMRPASWTCPTAKGIEDRETKQAAWTVEEKSTRRARAGRCGANAWWLVRDGR